MEFKEAVKKTEQVKEIKKLKSSGYFLNSGIAVIAPNDKVKQWMLTFYSMKEGKVALATVSDTVELSTPAKPINPTKKELDYRKIRTNSDKVLQKAVKEFKKFKEPLTETIMSIQDDGSVTWRVNFITKTLRLVTVTVSAEDGKILNSQMASLTK